MKTTRVLSRLAVSLALIPLMLLSTLVLGLASQADAQTGPVCATGVFDGTECVIEGAPPVSGPATCPVSATVIESGTECYTLVPTESVCPAGAVDVQGECQQPVADIPGALVCAPGHALEANECVRYEVPNAASCTNGTLVGNVCEIVGAPPVNGPSTCPVSATVIESGTECYSLIARPVIAGTCDAPYIAFGTTCKTNNTGTTQAEVATFTCPAGPAGITVIENMHTIGGIVKIESCEYIPNLGTGPCPTNTTPDPNGLDCRRPVDRVPGAATCAASFAIVDGQCIRYEAPVPADPCPTGDLTASGCRIIGDPPVAGPSTCPASAQGAPGSCYIVVPADQVCPAGTTPDGADPLSCREPVDRVPGALMCAPGFGLLGTSCIRYEPAVYLCDGQVVSINMVTGDDGQGTSGDDVILGTSGADTIVGRGGNDLICAGAGEDIVTGGSGDDTIYGQSGDDDIRGGQGNDTIRGNSGDDDIRGNGGDDDIRGGNGDDVIRGGYGDDDIRGNRGNDELRGNSGNDELRGGQDNDALIGGADTDTCNGGTGTDTATGSCETTSNTP